MSYLVRLAFFICVFALASCFDDLSNLSTNFKLRICDAPDANIRSFIVDIQAVQVNIASDSDQAGWKTLDNVKSGQIDLMKLTNGTDSLLANQALPTGRINQIKLILGDNNKIVLKDGSEKLLYFQTSQLNTLKCNVNSDLYADVDCELFLDFDVARSYFVDKYGRYYLRPTLRVFNQSFTGTVGGQITPSTFETYVGLISGTDTIAGTITKNGHFLIKGIDPGSDYRLVLVPPADSNYWGRSIESVSVVAHRQSAYSIDLKPKNN